MTLHLEQIIDDIEAMSLSLTATDRREWLRAARQLLRAHDRARLVAKLDFHRASPRPKLAPDPLGSLDERLPPPPAPRDYTVVAADGSSIAPDRDSPARFYLLNTSLVTLRYGRAPAADIGAQAELGYQYEDLYWDAQRERPVDERRLSLLMRVREVERLADAVETLGFPAVALVDGQLILWGLQTEHEADQRRLLGRLHAAFDRLREYGIPIVGYISDTDSFELVNTLRIYLCPTTPSQCQGCHARGAAEVQLCFHLNHFRDPALLFNFLDAGERSCCFASNADILQGYAPDHRIVYFFLSTGDEIARVEVPRWVADDPAMLDLVHAVLHDQCRLSGRQPPYPPALHEAHEAAVISTSDRDLVRLLVEERLQRAGSYGFRPAKSFHKRRRGV